MSKALTNFLNDVRVMTIHADSNSLLVSQYGTEVVIQISGNPSNHKRIAAEFCSPNTIADICMNQLGFDLTSEQVVEISNWVE